MASLGFQISFFLLSVLVLSPQIQAREGKVFSLFSHFRVTNIVNDHQDLPEKPKSESPATSPAPITAPTEAPIEAPTPAPTTESGPAPEPDFVDMGNGYGLYGTDDSKSQYYSPNKETPTTKTNFENQLLNEDFTGENYKTDKPSTNFNNNNNYNANNYNNEEVYRNNNNEEVYGYNNYNNEEVYGNNNDNNEEYRGNYNNGYNKNHVDNSYSNNNYNEERYSNNNYNGNEYNNNKNYNNYNSNNGYEVKREGMSDTRFMENGKYSYPVKNNNENYNLNEYESVRGNTENEGYYDKTKYPNEFDTMEEYEKQQESQGYTP